MIRRIEYRTPSIYQIIVLDEYEIKNNEPENHKEKGG